MQHRSESSGKEDASGKRTRQGGRGLWWEKGERIRLDAGRKTALPEKIRNKVVEKKRYVRPGAISGPIGWEGKKRPAGVSASISVNEILKS